MKNNQNRWSGLCVLTVVITSVLAYWNAFQARATRQGDYHEHINLCVDLQYDGNGNSTDASGCRLGRTIQECVGNCYKYSTAGNTANCKDCQSSGVAFWQECSLTSTGPTSLPGTKWKSNCVGTGNGGCGCSEAWILVSETTVPCYQASGDSCWL